MHKYVLTAITSHMRVLLATSFHEDLAALAGFHLNWQAALSGRMVTIAHLSATTRRDMLEVLAEKNVLPSVEGLIVNPVSIPTRFGSALPMLIHNHQTATRMGVSASHICLASPYLYALQPSLDDAIERFDCGLPATTYPLQKSWHWYDAVAGDARITALVKHLGTVVQVGRADGVYMTRAIFDAMLELLKKFFQPNELMMLGPIYPLEEILFTTVLPALLGSTGRIGSTRARVWEPGDPPTVDKLKSAITSGLHASAKRIPQAAAHPVRKVVLANLPGHLVLNAKLATTEA